MIRLDYMLIQNFNIDTNGESMLMQLNAILKHRKVNKFSFYLNNKEYCIWQDTNKAEIFDKYNRITGSELIEVLNYLLEEGDWE